jgi:hypothetical protein
MSSSEIQSRGQAIVITTIITPIVTSIFVFMRFYSRAFLAHFLGWDDYVVIGSLVSCIAYSVLIREAVNNGMGMHIDDLKKDQALFERYDEWIIITSEVYLLSLMGYKTAILLTYYRIFEVSRHFRYACWAVMFFVVGYLSCNMLTEVFGCHPIQKFWDPNFKPGSCIAFTAADIAYGAMHVSSDFAIALLPLRMVWRLHMDRRDKIGVTLVFLTGIIAFAVALVRWTLSCIDLTSYDRTWVAGLTFLWSVLEVNTGLICASCLPLKPLYHLLRTSSLCGGKPSRSGSSPGKLLIARERQNVSLADSDKRLSSTANSDTIKDTGFSHV